MVKCFSLFKKFDTLPPFYYLESAGAITVHSIMAPSGELRGKGRCGVFAGKNV